MDLNKIEYNEFFASLKEQINILINTKKNMDSKKTENHALYKQSFNKYQQDPYIYRVTLNEYNILNGFPSIYYPHSYDSDDSVSINSDDSVSINSDDSDEDEDEDDEDKIIHDRHLSKATNHHREELPWKELILLPPNPIFSNSEIDNQYAVLLNMQTDLDSYGKLYNEFVDACKSYDKSEKNFSDENAKWRKDVKALDFLAKSEYKKNSFDKKLLKDSDFKKLYAELKQLYKQNN
jgi:hypothetical protein